MSKDSERTIRTDRAHFGTSDETTSGLASTLEINRKTFIGKIPTAQHAFLEIMGEERKQVKLGEGDTVIGRVPECDIQLIVENVSRKHARIIYRNEEYQIEDLGSTNGIYVNGIKVEKCILRNQDLLEVGGVKILFNEEKVVNQP